jgi:signal transduction histidine kinase
MDLFTVIAGLNTAFALLAALIILFQNKHGKGAYILGLLALSVGTWSASVLVQDIFSQNQFLVRVAAHAGLASFFLIALFHCAATYVVFAVSYIRRSVYYAAVTVLGLGAVASTVPGVFVWVDQRSGDVSHAALLGLGIALWFLAVGASFRFLRKAYAAAEGMESARISLFTLASVCLVAGFFPYAASWYGNDILTIVYICVSLYIALAAYAVFARRIADIHTIISQFVVYGISVLGVLGISGILLVVFQQDRSRGFIFENLAVIVIGLLFLPLLVRMASRMHRSITDINPDKARAALKEQVGDLITILDLKSLTAECVALLRQITTAHGVAILIRSDATHNLEGAYGDGFDLTGKLFEQASNPIIGAVKNERNILFVDERGAITGASQVNGMLTAPELASALAEASVALLVPLIGKSGLIGCMVLGHKTVGGRYRPEEIELLEFFAGECGVAIENARAYSETSALSSYLQNMNADLLRKIEHATAELKVKNKALETANQKLKELSELKTDFLNMASHQFKTPTTVIRGMLSMIEKKEVNDATRDSFIHKMRESADRLNTLITDFLNAAKIEGGGLALKHEPNDAAEFIRKIADDLLPIAQKKGLALTITQHPEGKIPAAFDTQRMHEALYNFIDNAIKYTPSGSVSLAISKDERSWTLEVRDSGIGIPEAEIKKLFQKFYRTESAARETSNGTGLGLYVAKKIIEEHGGSVTVASPGAGQGTTFTVHVPLDPVQPPVS